MSRLLFVSLALLFTSCSLDYVQESRVRAKYDLEMTYHASPDRRCDEAVSRHLAVQYMDSIYESKNALWTIRTVQAEGVSTGYDSEFFILDTVHVLTAFNSGATLRNGVVVVRTIMPSDSSCWVGIVK